MTHCEPAGEQDLSIEPTPTEGLLYIYERQQVPLDCRTVRRWVGKAGWGEGGVERRKAVCAECGRGGCWRREVQRCFQMSICRNGDFLAGSFPDAILQSSGLCVCLLVFRVSTVYV